MHRFGLAFAAAFALVAAPLAASAAAPTPYTKDQLAQGKKEVPAVLQTAGVTCTMTNAAFVGQSETKPTDKSKPVKQSVYEVACSEGLGYALLAPVGGAVQHYDCLTLQGNASLTCKLPENADPKQGFAPMVSQVGRTCTINNARALGATPTGTAYYEIGCSNSLGFVLQTAPGKPAKAVDCASVAGGNLECKFTTSADIEADNARKIAVLTPKIGKPCQVSKSRSIGELQSGEMAYEVACSDGSGYVLEANKAGEYVRSINCANSGGACKLTDTTQAESAETGTYTRLAKAGGFNCDVSKYRFIGVDTKTNSEVVELQCANRPEGQLAFFAANNGPGSKFYDCVAAGALGQSCKLTTDQASVYPKYTAALASKGKNTCKVSNARGIGVSADGSQFIETACADGLPGWVLVMSTAGQTSDVLTCGQAKSVGGCQLPGNTK